MILGGPSSGQPLVKPGACEPWFRTLFEERRAIGCSQSPQKAGEFPLRPSAMLQKHVKPAIEAAQLGKGIGWHTFRHAYSSMLRQLGVDFKVQQELLWHADIRTTMNVYTQAVSEDKRVAHSEVVRMVHLMGCSHTTPSTSRRRLQKGQGCVLPHLLSSSGRFPACFAEQQIKKGSREVARSQRSGIPRRRCVGLLGPTGVAGQLASACDEDGGRYRIRINI